MKNRIEDIHPRYVEALTRAMEIEQRIARAHPAETDRQLAEEFENYLRETECHLARIEYLLRPSASHGRA